MKKILIIISILFCCLTIFQVTKSFGLFESNIEDETDLTIAKWHIVVNDSDLNQTDRTFYVDEISYVDREGNAVSKFAPGVTGNFLIEIDPKDTEVAFEYKMKIDLENQEYEQITVDEVIGINGTQLTEQDGTYSRVMTLDEIEAGKKDTIQVIFHWEWNDAYNDSDSKLGQDPDSQFLIPITIGFEQYIE